MDKFNLIKKEIDSITKKAPIPIEYKHSQSILKILLKLNPKADISLKIAALGHDIDRSIPELRIKPKGFKDYNKYKKQHSIRSAEIIVNLMESMAFKKEIIEKTKFLIENHEVGGETDVETLKEADSISFFQDNLEYYKKKYPDYFKDKVEFMYKRLSSKAREIVLKLKIKNKEIEKEVKDIISKL